MQVDILENLIKILIKTTAASNKLGFNLHLNETEDLFGKLYCPRCGDLRRVKITPIYLRLDNNTITAIIITNLKYGRDKERTLNDVYSYLSPSLYDYMCLQCELHFTAVIYNGARGQSLAVLPSYHGGFTTPNTPKGVSYYLDQASKAQSVGANSAAMAMYRGALEHILFEQGYKNGMLGVKLNDLSKDIANNKAPKWAMELNTDFLKLLKEIGNGAIHPNDGDITKQSEIDNELLSKVESVFRYLLFRIYEAPKKQQDWLTSLGISSSILSK